jgi:cation diffusion facilitator CzcD-associated flavoprotein CzcO
MIEDRYDIVIIGAGLSGIGAACRLERQCPDKRYAILESRESIGGTWDLFRYPGIRSDSDMFTLGYDFRPWRESKAIADGASILKYISETAREYGLDQHIRYGHRVTDAYWSSEEAEWTVHAEADTAVRIRARMLLICAGYYRYEQGYLPDFKGRERFAGMLVHPQHWPEDLDCSGKKIVVIGSGATAVTLVPELARNAGTVVMLQRSPTYMIARPDTDWIANVLKKILPARAAYAMTRWKNIGMQQWLYRQTRKRPQAVRRKLLRWARSQLGPDVDIEAHFTPEYDPWDQRLCLVPNGDFFQAVRSGRASVVTDGIESFTERGLLLKSGAELEADIVVTATGLDVVALGEIRLSVDGEPVVLADKFSYRGVMLSDVPNCMSTFGYINASWTLRADLTAEYFCRLVHHMDQTGCRQCTPELQGTDRNMQAKAWITGFTPGYLQRVMGRLPKQGDREPWLNPQNYAHDRKVFRHAPLDDGVLRFTNPAPKRAAST